MLSRCFLFVFSIVLFASTQLKSVDYDSDTMNKGIDEIRGLLLHHWSEINPLYKALLSKKFNLKVINDNGDIVRIITGEERLLSFLLIKAAFMGLDNACLMLLLAGADINTRTGELGLTFGPALIADDFYTPLMIATRMNHLRLFSKFLSWGANPNIKDKYGEVLIDKFFGGMVFDHFDRVLKDLKACGNVVKLLLSYGSDLPKKKRSGNYRKPMGLDMNSFVSTKNNIKKKNPIVIKTDDTIKKKVFKLINRRMSSPPMSIDYLQYYLGCC